MWCASSAWRRAKCCTLRTPLTVFRVCGVDTVAFILVNLAEHGQEAIDTTDQLIQ